MAFVLLLLLAIFVAPWINVSHFRRRIVQSISEGLGRPVHVGYVSFRLFPQPAFVLSNFSVAEDPAFGAEPVMSAASVTATLRASTLWHRRVDVATLSFDNPSLNLTRNAAGQWDFDSILLRASMPHASRPEPFPYVEASGARINFKFSDEKQPFSLLDADVALWKDSDGQWHVRLKAQPVRTDLNLTDTGELRAEAVMQYAKTSGDAPITAHAEWRKAPLGEISRLLLGKDTGWRGTADMTADANGTLAAMDIVTDTQVEGFRRAEFIPPAEIDWEIQCKAHYQRSLALFSPIACDAPLDTGSMHLMGTLSLLPRRADTPESETSNVHLTLHQVPTNFVLNIIRHLHAGIPAEASATGELNGHLNCVPPTVLSPNPCEGDFHTARWTLTLPDVPEPLAFSPLDIVDASSATRSAASAIKAAHKRQLSRAPSPPLTGFVVEPVHIALGATAPATVTGALASHGYNLALNGPATLDYLMPIMHTLGLQVYPTQIRSAHGDAQLELALRGSWLPAQNTETTLSAHPSWAGTVHLQNARIALKDWPGHILFSSAILQLNPGMVSWNNIQGSYQKENFDGNFQYNTMTVTDSPSVRTFHLHVENLNAGHLQRSLLAADAQSSSLLGLVERWAGNSPELPKLTGEILADHLSVETLIVTNARMMLQIEGRKAVASAISGETLGGTLTGSGSVDWTTNTPAYRGQFAFHAIQPNAIAGLFHAVSWGHGTANLMLDLTTHGLASQDLMQQAEAHFTGQWKMGGWDASTLAKTPLARFRQLALEGKVQNQVVQIASGIFAPGFHSPSMTGTVSFVGQVDLHLQPSKLQINGTLAHPALKQNSEKTVSKIEK
jgi:hypothetical protein